MDVFVWKWKKHLHSLLSSSSSLILVLVRKSKRICQIFFPSLIPKARKRSENANSDTKRKFNPFSFFSFMKYFPTNIERRKRGFSSRRRDYFEIFFILFLTDFDLYSNQKFLRHFHFEGGGGIFIFFLEREYFNHIIKDPLQVLSL